MRRAPIPPELWEMIAVLAVCVVLVFALVPSLFIIGLTLVRMWRDMLAGVL